METVKKTVPSSCLAPLFVLDKEMEPYPDPFRLQGHVVMKVNYSDYVDFCKTALDKVDYLATPTATLKSYILHKDTSSLYSAFVKDMAIAISKEIHYAEAQAKAGTRYIHFCYGVEEYTQDKIDSLFEQVGFQVGNILRQYMASKGFAIPNVISRYNVKQWQYAVVMYLYGSNGCNPWMLGGGVSWE